MPGIMEMLSPVYNVTLEKMSFGDGNIPNSNFTFKIFNGWQYYDQNLRTSSEPFLENWSFRSFIQYVRSTCWAEKFNYELHILPP